MTVPPDLPREDDLLHHREWLRRLASVLARDSHEASDIEQQTWLTALQTPPSDRTRPRAWLGTVVRNWMRRRVRSETRRTRREQSAARDERVRSTDQVAGEWEVAALLSRAVQALDDPLRTVVLLRFYEGLTVRQIAERMQSPYETTRSRLRTALQQLRGLVTPDADPIAPVLVPFSLAALQSVTTSPQLQGVFLMTKTAKLAAAAIVVAVLATGGVWATAVSFPPTSLEVADAIQDRHIEDPQVARMQERIEELEWRLSQRRRRAKRDKSVASPVTDPPLTRGSVALQGSIVDALGASLARSLLTGVPRIEARVQIPQATIVPVKETSKPVDLAQLSDRELLAHARALGSSSKPGAAQAWTAVLDRRPEVATQDEALFGLGIAHRRAGDHDGELDAFQRLADLAGPTTNRGEEARYQRAWALYYGRKHDDATREMEAIADATNGSTDRARHALLNGSSFASAGADTARARAMLERLQRLVKDDKTSLARWFDRMARNQLKGLE